MIVFEFCVSCLEYFSVVVYNGEKTETVQSVYCPFCGNKKEKR